MNLVAPHVRPQATHLVSHGEGGDRYRTMCDAYAFGKVYEVTGWDDIACKRCIDFAHRRHVDALRPPPTLD